MAIAGLLAAASLATALILVADPWPSVWLPGVAVNGALTAAGAGLLLAFRDHVTPWMRHLVLGLGTLGLASALVYGGGGAPTALFSLMYVWVGVYAGAHMTPYGALAHLGLAGVTATTGLLIVDPAVEAAVVAVMGPRRGDGRRLGRGLAHLAHQGHGQHRIP